MSGLEIALLIGGALIFILSFIIPVKKQEASEDIREMIGDEVKGRVKEEIDEIRNHIDDVVDEAVDYAQEKTERSLERISNEKIMAVNEYSDTVLDEINKNHKEVMFLYDMLSDKHDDLITSVSEANQAAKEASDVAVSVHEITKEAEAAAANFISLTPEAVDAKDSDTVIKTDKKVENWPEVPKAQIPAGEKKVRTLKWAAYAQAQADEALGENPQSQDDIQLVNTGEDDAYAGQNPQADLHNEVLTLHKLGKTDVEIAKSLGMGVGEVSLIIGLHGK